MFPADATVLPGCRRPSGNHAEAPKPVSAAVSGLCFRLSDRLFGIKSALGLESLSLFTVLLKLEKSVNHGFYGKIG